MSFYTDVIKKDPRVHLASPCHDVSLLFPPFRDRIMKMIDLARQAGHDLRIGETFRSQALQSLYYTQGKTELRQVGCHGYGVACDILLFKNGQYDQKSDDYKFFQELCEQVRIISGIDWGTSGQSHSFHDWDHVQMVPVFRQAALFSGEWYPSADYDPYLDQLQHHILGADK